MSRKGFTWNDIAGDGRQLSRADIASLVREFADSIGLPGTRKDVFCTGTFWCIVETVEVYPDQLEEMFCDRGRSPTEITDSSLLHVRPFLERDVEIDGTGAETSQKVRAAPRLMNRKMWEEEIIPAVDYSRRGSEFPRRGRTSFSPLRRSTSGAHVRRSKYASPPRQRR